MVRRIDLVTVLVQVDYVLDVGCLYLRHDHSDVVFFTAGPLVTILFSDTLERSFHVGGHRTCIPADINSAAGVLQQLPDSLPLLQDDVLHVHFLLGLAAEGHVQTRECPRGEMTCQLVPIQEVLKDSDRYG